MLTHSNHRLGMVTVASAALGLLCIVGCGSTPDAGPPASGTVTLDGTPLTAGSLEFMPAGGDGSSAFAPINTDGTFQVATSAGQSGIAPGKYKVVVVPGDVEEDDDGQPIGGQNIPEKYTDEETTDLSVTISADGPNELKIELSSAGGDAAAETTAEEGDDAAEASAEAAEGGE